MPVSAGISILIILAVALTTFATRVTPFLVFPKGKRFQRRYRSWKSIDTGSDRDACCILFKSTPVRGRRMVFRS